MIFYRLLQFFTILQVAALIASLLRFAAEILPPDWVGVLTGLAVFLAAFIWLSWAVQVEFNISSRLGALAIVLGGAAGIWM